MSAERVGALVTGADGRGLGIVQSLGRRGIPLWVLTKSGHVLASWSRYSKRALTWPEGDEATQVAFLTHLAARKGLQGWVLFPTDDEAVALIGRNHALLSNSFRLTTEPWQVLHQVCDKRSLNQLAERLGIAYPQTFLPRTSEDVAQLKCKFPVIIKPAIREALNRLTIDKAWRADDMRSLLELYERAKEIVASEQIMVQELVPGGGEAQFSFAAVCSKGAPLVSLTARRTRQFPMDFGRFSTFVETINNPAVVEPAIRLLKEVQLSGLVEVEFKYDARDGGMKVLDVNPRVWGWQTLGARAGADFAYSAFLLAAGNSVQKAQGRPGVRWFRMSADFPVAIKEVFARRLGLAGYLRSLFGHVQYSVFAVDDPMPALLELPLQASRLCLLTMSRMMKWLTSRGREEVAPVTPPSAIPPHKLKDVHKQPLH